MTNPKFDETDRRKVIAEIESHFEVKLTPVGTRRKYLQDQNKRTFWVFGGYEDWHGIPVDMMEAEEKRNFDGILVVAKRGLSKIDIYTGSLLPLIKSKKTLSHTKNGEYQFNIRLRGNSLSIHEVPGLHLSRLGAASYSMAEKTSDKKIEKVEAIIRRLSPEARNQLLEELSKKGET
jgi:hypothetical protein